MLPNWTGCVHCSDRNKVSIPQLVDEETPVDHHFLHSQWFTDRYSHCKETSLRRNSAVENIKRKGMRQVDDFTQHLRKNVNSLLQQQHVSLPIVCASASKQEMNGRQESVLQQQQPG